jgi:uncharacterized OB-fold protein
LPLAGTRSAVHGQGHRTTRRPPHPNILHRSAKIRVDQIELSEAQMHPNDTPPVEPLRIPRDVDDAIAGFWLASNEGVLRMKRCEDCERWSHPSHSICRYCNSRDLSSETVSGLGSVVSFTINDDQSTLARRTDPYTIAIIQLDEDPSLRLISNVVNCPIESVHIGQEVRLVFGRLGDIWFPLFEPRT